MARPVYRSPVYRGPVYRDMSVEELNRQYSARDAVPEHPEIFERWRRLSVDYRAKARAELNISYGPNPKNVFDLFIPYGERPDGERPDGEGPFPVHVYIHGGYWQAMDKDDQSYFASALVDAGVAVAVLNYTLCPEISVSGIVEEIRDALAGLYKHASDLQCDPDRLHVSGHSAGGHLVGMLLATDWRARDENLPCNPVKSGLSISGIFELEALAPTKINTVPGMTVEEARANSPIFMTPTADVPLSLAVGGEESAEFQRQSADLAEIWRSTLSQVDAWSGPGLNHFSLVETLADSRSKLFATALGFALG